MRFADPYALRNKEPRETIVFAASQMQGAEITQEDYFLNFNDECFIIADGQRSVPNGHIAAKLACETAIWAFKHIRQHRSYWLDKKNFMRRIFRTTNMTIWQKQRDKGFEEGLATTLMVLVVGPKSFWLGSSGNSSAWISKKGSTLVKLTKDAWSLFVEKPRVLGMQRLGLFPEFVTGPFERDDTIVLATDGIAGYLTQQDLEHGISLIGKTVESASGAAITLLKAAQANGSEKNMTSVVVRRIENK